MHGLPGLARLEMARDETVRQRQNTEKRFQVAKDLADNLRVAFNSSEVIMARLLQTTSAKEWVYLQALSYFGPCKIRDGVEGGRRRRARLAGQGRDLAVGRDL